MKCMHCGTSLPRGAIFCGECGRRTGSTASAQELASTAQPAAEITPPPPAPELDGPPTARRGWSLSAEGVADAASRTLSSEVTRAPGGDDGAVPDDSAPRGSESDDSVPDDAVPGERRSAAEAALAGVVRNPLACEQCGTAMGPGDIFCGECGSVSRSVTAAFTSSTPVTAPQTAGNDPDSGEDPVQLVVPAAPVAPPLPTMPVFVQSPPGTPPVPAPPPSDPGTGSGPASRSRDDDDLEATRIVSRRNGQRFVLQFSTGESVTVYGTGLIGRNPRPEPGEYFDQLVRVLDTGRSVSKTHLEFGQDNGAFWVKDRYSGNGTVLKEPDAEARRCDPDKRYRVLRGSRVEVGEQFFVVS